MRVGQAAMQCQSLSRVAESFPNNCSLMKTFLLTLVLSVLAFAELSSAAPIVGDITFAGRVTFDTNDVNTADSVTSWFNTHVENSDGDFGSVAPNTAVTFAAPWIFDPSTPTPNFWSTGGFTFDLLSATILNQGHGFLNIEGTGIVSSSNEAFDPTIGTFDFSAQSPRTAGTFSFSAGTQDVPEPGSLAMLTLGAGILAGLARRTVLHRGNRLSVN